MGQRVEQVVTKPAAVRRATEAAQAYIEAEERLTEVEAREAREAARAGVR